MTGHSYEARIATTRTPKSGSQKVAPWQTLEAVSANAVGPHCAAAVLIQKVQ